MPMVRRDERYGTILAVVLSSKGTMDIQWLDMTAIPKSYKYLGSILGQVVTVSIPWLNMVVIVRVIPGV